MSELCLRVAGVSERFGGEFSSLPLLTKSARTLNVWMSLWTSPVLLNIHSLENAGDAGSCFVEIPANAIHDPLRQTLLP